MTAKRAPILLYAVLLVRNALLGGIKHPKERLNVTLVNQVNLEHTTAVLQTSTATSVLPGDFLLRRARLSVLCVARPSINRWKGGLRVWSVRKLVRLVALTVFRAWKTLTLLHWPGILS